MRIYIYGLFAGFAAIPLIFTASAPGADREIKQAVGRAKPDSDLIETREFEVRVDNRVAGTHSLVIKSDGDRRTVKIQTDVKVDVIVYAYVFKLRGTEIWRDGQLEETDIRCEDGGKKRSFSLKTEGTIQQVVFNGKSVPKASNVAMTTTYWKLPPTSLRQKSLPIVDVDTGAIGDATLQLVGPDTVAAGDRNFTCQHFKIDGPSPAELWFDEQGHLVRQKSVESGHPMELKLKQIRIAKDEN